MELSDIVYNIQELGKLRSKLNNLFEKESEMCPHVVSRESSLFEGDMDKSCNREDNLSVGMHYTPFCKPEFCPIRKKLDKDIEGLSAYPKK